jgi:hypothetical protein
MATKDEQEEKMAAIIAQLAKVRRDSETFALRLVGAVLVVIGIGASVWSYSHAKPGGSYVVTVGLIVGGLSLFWRGLTRH